MRRFRFRFRYKVLGGHTHIRLFAGTGETLGKAGDIVLRNEEFASLREDFEDISEMFTIADYEFVEEERGPAGRLP